MAWSSAKTEWWLSGYYGWFWSASLEVYRAWSPDARSHLMHAFSKIQPQHSTMDNIRHNDWIELAITDLESQDCPNYASTTKKYHVNRSTLSRRYRGVTGTRQDAISYSSRALTDTQENVLVQYINKLSARGLPPTLRLLKISQKRSQAKN